MLTKDWMGLRDELLKTLPGVVSAWRRLARGLDLKESRIAWLGPIERVAFRVLEEAKRDGWTHDMVRVKAAAVILEEGQARARGHLRAVVAAELTRRERDSEAETISVTSASADRAANAVRAMLKLGDAAREALYAQGDVMGERNHVAARAKIEAARSFLAEAEAELDALG